MAPTLSSKDQNALKNIAKLFDDKKYKKGLKTCETFLKTHPENVDALCFKALLVYHLEKRDEAFDLAKNIIKSNMSSSVAWHTYGFLYRSDKNYAEASKCFKNAHKFNKESTQILRDLSNIQLYQRDLQGLKETYTALLQLGATQKAYWVGLIITNHLMGNKKTALHVLDEFLNVMEEKEKTGLKGSELTLYRCMLLTELGEYDKAIEMLVKEEKNILDKLWAKQKHGEILILKNNKQDAEKIFRELLKLNSDNLTIHKKIWECRGIPDFTKDNFDHSTLTEEQIKFLTSFYKDLNNTYPKSLLIQKVPLMFTQDREQFTQFLSKYINHFLAKGIPSLFNNLKGLYNNATKVEIIENTFKATLESLEKKSTFPNQEEQQSPSSVLWTLYYLAQHFDKLNNYEQSLSYIDQGIKHTPTCLDLYIIKAKLFKHQGNISGAFQEYNRARQLDLADRYLNTKTVKYALRNDDPVTAEEIYSLIKDESQPLWYNIGEFQVMWYEKELGSAYLRAGNYGKALKAFYLVDKHFTEFMEDQFDFHNHITKKMTLRSYIEFLRWEDGVFQNKPFTDSAKLLVQSYLHLKNNSHVLNKLKREEPIVATPVVSTTASSADDDDEDDKPAANTNKKAAANKNKSETAATPAPSAAIPPDTDPNGEKYLKEENYLVPATKFIEQLLKFTPTDVQVHALACQVFLQEKKYLLVLKSVLKLKELGGVEGPLYHQYLITLLHTAQADKECSELILKALEKEKNALTGGASLAEYNQQFANKHKDSVPHKYVAGLMMNLISPADKSKATELILDLQGSGAHWEQSFNNYQSLHSAFDSTVAEQYRQQCEKRFPRANCFAPKQE
ncbi:hypothetical protein CYY_000463 [Polysphondylium violaceum]|uniref:Tetratricopeptide-like helical domain-containing protein n=1 Tax=Polysphondylium violaceum TaxID=133409 RepID=A0A8J4PZU3_9MYCE|nr:hypothetical protein CYY_000463 [Polysphondylium violaceum]